MDRTINALDGEDVYWGPVKIIQIDVLAINLEF
jgi:hypothetical protein